MPISLIEYLSSLGHIESLIFFGFDRLKVLGYDGKYFLALNINESAEELEWYYSEVKQTDIIHLKKGEHATYDLFRNAHSGFVYEVVTDLGHTIIEAKIIQCIDLLDENLPEKNAVIKFLESDESDFRVAEYFQNDILKYRIVGDLVGFGSAIDSEALSEYVLTTQKAVRELGWEFIQGKSRIEHDVRNREIKVGYTRSFSDNLLTLKVAPALAASFQLSFVPTEMLDTLGQSITQRVLQKFVSLSTSNKKMDESLEEILQFHHKTVSAFISFWKAVQASNAKVEIEYQEFRRRMLHKGELNREIATAYLDRLSEVTESTNLLKGIIGTLIGFNLRLQTFEVFSDQEEKYAGSVDQHLFRHFEALFVIGKRYTFDIEEKSSRIAGQEKTEFILIEVDTLD